MLKNILIQWLKIWTRKRAKEFTLKITLQIVKILEIIRKSIKVREDN
tara:strand:+ start:77 stop:217 length:141 start_codon:yes stop_codon:yes gene_type:complete